MGKGAVVVSWLKEVMFVWTEFSINRLKFSLLNFSPSSKIKFSENGGKTLGPACLWVCASECAVALFCKSALSKADIVLSQLCALCSEYLTMIEHYILIYAKYERNL